MVPLSTPGKILSIIIDPSFLFHTPVHWYWLKSRDLWCANDPLFSLFLCRFKIVCICFEFYFGLILGASIVSKYHKLFFDWDTHSAVERIQFKPINHGHEIALGQLVLKKSQGQDNSWKVSNITLHENRLWLCYAGSINLVPNTQYSLQWRCYVIHKFLIYSQPSFGSWYIKHNNFNYFQN